MNAIRAERHGSGTWAPVVQRWRRLAWLVLLIADAGLLVWGAGAAAIPGHLLGPGGGAILPAGYEGYSRGSWHQLVVTSPQTAGYITIAFVSAMTYDRIVGAIGPFEWSEYLGLAVIYGSLAVTAPALTRSQAVRAEAASPSSADIDERQALRG